MKIISAIKKHPFRFSMVILSVSFIFSHAPFFIWMGIPHALPDTFDYYNTADILMHRPVSDLRMQPIELPLGYPIFLIFNVWLSHKFITIVLIQSLLKFISCAALMYVFCRYYGYYAFLASLALSIYLSNSTTIRLDTTIYPESVYNALLMLLTVLFVHALHRNSIASWIYVGVFLFLPSFFRPNGAYVYFIIGFVFLAFWVKKEPVGKYLAIFLPVLLLNLAWASFNVKAYAKFVPGNFIRFTRLLEHNKSKPLSQTQTPVINNATKIVPLSIANRLAEYSTIMDLPQFYYLQMPDRYTALYVDHQMTDTTYKMYDWQIPISDNLRKMVYKDFFGSPNRFQEVFKNVRSHHSFMGIWLVAYHLWYKFEELVLRNRLLFILFASFTIFILYGWIRTGFQDNVYLLLSVLGLLHLFNIIVIAFAHAAIQPRYSHVSEFFVYLVFALTPLLLAQKEKQTQTEYAE